MAVYGGKSVPTHSLEERGVPKFTAAEILAIFSEDFMERTDGWDLGDQILEFVLGSSFAERLGEAVAKTIAKARRAAARARAATETGSPGVPTALPWTTNQRNC